MSERNLLIAKQLNERIQRHLDGTVEYWRDIPQWEGFYRVSDLGRVQSVTRIVVRGGWQSTVYKGRILKTEEHKRKFIAVTLSKKKRRVLAKNCILVLESFVGHRPRGKWALHWDDNYKNNNLSNLRWGTPKENYQDKKRNGKGHDGEGNPKAKLTWAEVKEIRSLYKTGRSQCSIGREFGVSQTTIRGIVFYKLWNDVRVNSD